MALQNCAIESMNKFLNNIYYIPNYQREYSWEVNELTDFWEDLMAVNNSADNIDHFFGQIVVHNQDGQKRFIIDGQQRTITSTIFMRTLQYFYELIYQENHSLAASYKMSDIASMHIGRYLSESDNKLHLHLGEKDRDFFREQIQLGAPDVITKKAESKSQKRLCFAYNFFYKGVLKELDSVSDLEDKIEILDSFYHTFVDKFNILYMEATKLEEAFVIFETLNARGKDLETADLLKNFVFGQSKDVELAQKLWKSMMEKLDHADPTKYIRHYWNANHSFVREKVLYKRIREKASTPKECKDLLRNLDAAAQCYHDISCPDEIKGYKDKRLIAGLKSLKKLKASSFYPVLLAIDRLPNKMPENDIATIVEALESYVFRNFTICGKVANRAEVTLANIAKEISDEILDSTQAVVERIKAEMVSDIEFQDAFKVWTGGSSAKETIRYIFRKIHHYLDKNNELNMDNSEVHIEHIMPEDCSQWDVDDEIHEAYLWRLGNLMLLSGPINIVVSNKPFLDKREGYINSKIEPNAEVAKEDKWTAVEIEKRQKALANLALQIWKK